MTQQQTRVGIVEWATRAQGSSAVSGALADGLGAHVRAASPDEQGRLLDRARRHAWCARAWDDVVPVLHDVAVDRAPIPDAELRGALGAFRGARSADAALAAEQVAATRLTALWESWRAEGASVADGPYLAALDRVLRELGGGDG